MIATMPVTVAPPERGATVWDADRPEAPGGAAGRPVVLVVTRDDALRRELAAALRAHWMLVDQAADGLAALYALHARTPDAVVLDMDVPEVSGHRVYRVLREDPGTRRAPVVMVSGETCQEVCEPPGAVAPPEQFLQKPVTAEAVLGALAMTGALPAYARN